MGDRRIIVAYTGDEVTAYIDVSEFSIHQGNFGTEEEFMARKSQNTVTATTGATGETGQSVATNVATMPAEPREKKAKPLPSAADAPEWDQYPELRELGFADLVAKRLDLKSEIDFRAARLKDLDIEIQSLLAVAGTEKVTWEGRPVQMIHSRSGSRIVAEKLLLAGVAASVISDATEQGKEYSYLLVGKVGKQ